MFDDKKLNELLGYKTGAEGLNRTHEKPSFSSEFLEEVERKGVKREGQDTREMFKPSAMLKAPLPPVVSSPFAQKKAGRLPAGLPIGIALFILFCAGNEALCGKLGQAPGMQPFACFSK